MWTKEIHDRMLTGILPIFEEEIYALNDDIAGHPELGSAEFETSR